MPLTLTFEGPDDILEDGLLAYAKSQGWTETVVQEDGTAIVNPDSLSEYAERAVKRHILEAIVRQESRDMAAQAKKQAAQAAHNKYSAVK
jgi:hypothetical protein